MHQAWCLLYIVFLVTTFISKTDHFKSSNTPHDGYYDEHEDTAYELVDGLEIIGLESTQRLAKRNNMFNGPSEKPIVLQFDASGKRFAIRLKEHKNLLNEQTQARILDKTSKDPLAVSIVGRPYVGDRLVVADLQLISSMQLNISKLIELNAQEGVSVHEDDLFGRFYVSAGTGRGDIRGGFLYEGKFISLQNIEHPLLKQAASKFGSKLKSQRNNFIVSTQDFKNTHHHHHHHHHKDSNESGTSSHKCGHDRLKYNQQPNGGAASHYLKQLISSKLIEENPKKLFARTTNGCPATSKVIYIGVVADCNYMAKFDNDPVKAQANIINDFNLASAIFEDAFNIHLGLHTIDFMLDCDGKGHFNVPCSDKISLDDRLSRFSLWRDSQPQEAGLYHLVTGCGGSSVVGIAWLNQVCQTKSMTSAEGETVSGAAVTCLVKNQFSVIAHEIAHNFGAVHDCDAKACKECKSDGSDCQCCACKECDCQGKYIMDPESGGLNVDHFSSCTINDVCSKVAALAANCLKEPGTYKTISLAQCGNGVREEGEECDCGDEESCKDNPCCTTDCKLKSGAVCSDQNDRCCNKCQLIPANAKQICTPSQSKCRANAYCDGINRDCPKGIVVKDGTSCDADGSTCASGMCTSRNSQCMAIGNRNGITGDCSSGVPTCRITCSTGHGCVAFDANYADGTPCGHKGKCYNGQCSESYAVSYAYSFPIMTICIAVLIVLFGVSMCVCIIKTLRSCFAR